MSRLLRSKALGGVTALTCGAALVVTASFSVPVAVGTENLPDLMREADETVSIVEVVVADTAELDRLVETGADLDHAVHVNDDGTLTAHVVASPSEELSLTARGFTLASTVHDEGDTEAALAERDATIATARAENQAFAVAAASTSVSDVKVIRADYYTSFGQGYLSVEAKFANGQNVNSALVVERDSGAGTEIGSGGTQNISRFVDAGEYLYHRGSATVATRPDQIRVTSPTGDTVIATVNDWLPIDGDDVYGPNYETDFINSYLTPTELYERIHSLAAEFPEIAEIVELPYQTNGYRRAAQALLGNSNANRVGIDSHAWGHEGGNDLSVETVNPGTPNSPLSVAVNGC